MLKIKIGSGVAALFICCLLGSGAQAGILTLDPSGKSIDGIPIDKDASVSVADRRFELTTVGAGLRSKKVAIISVKVYVAELMVSDPSQFVRTEDGALGSLAGMSEVAIRLGFVRTVDAQTVQSSFQDALAANQIDLTTPQMQAVLNAVAAGGDATEGSAMTLVGERLPDGSEVLTYEDPTGKVTSVSGPAGFVKQIFSIWLGAPSDSGVETLKKALIAGY